MASLWDDRLAEVWAWPGKAGSGISIGARGVLTARHIVAEAVESSEADRLLARLVRRGEKSSPWVAMRLVADDPDWDLAVLEVDSAAPQMKAWSSRSSSPVLAAVGASAEDGCESVGFPDDNVQRPEGSGPADAVRQTEHVRGTLLPMGQAKRPIAPQRQLPLQWMPLDASSATPDRQAGWGGMSGAGVLLPDGRLIGVVVAAAAAHQQRRLYVVPLAAAITESPRLAEALATVLGAPMTVETRQAPARRRVLQNDTLRVDGSPLLLREVLDLGLFGVKPVSLADEPMYLNYVPRDADDRLAAAVADAARTKRMLLLVGDSGAGKSRSLAEAVRHAFPDHSMLVPAPGQLSELSQLPDLRPGLVWLDDLERYAQPSLREIVGRLVDAGLVVTGTIRRKQLEVLTAPGEIRYPSAELFADQRLVYRVDWKRQWSPAERARVPDYVTSTLARSAVAAGDALGVWSVAGPQLLTRLGHAYADEDYPCRFALVRVVLDWYRTGLTMPIPRVVALELMNQAYLDQTPGDDDIVDAINWCTGPTDIGGRHSRYSLLTLDHNDRLSVNDYVQDHDQMQDAPSVPSHVWEIALENAPDHTSVWNIGFSADGANQQTVAQAAWQLLAEAGDTSAMNNLAFLLAFSGRPEEALSWYLKAVNAGSIAAMVGLGRLFERQADAMADAQHEVARDLARKSSKKALKQAARQHDELGAARKDYLKAARSWYEAAVQRGDRNARTYLGVYLERYAPAEARRWHEQEAEAGDDKAAFNLGYLLARSEPEEAQRWYEQAAEAGDTSAMNNLGVLLLRNGKPDEARRWLERAAQAGDEGAARNLRALEGD